MNLFKKSIFVILLILSSIYFSSCSKKNSMSNEESNNVSNDNSKIVIGFSIDTLALERWQRDLDVFMNTAKELGAEVIVQNSGNSVEEQNRQLLYLAERKVNAIVVLAKKRDSLTDTIQKIRAKNIPVVSYDRLITNADISMYITVDTEQVGELMARQLLRISKGNNWYCILGPDEDYNMTLIKKGVGNVIGKTPVKITGTFYTDGWNYDLSNQKAVDLITSGNIPDAIVCGNDAVAGSVIQAFSMYLPERHVPICGQDADTAACKNIVLGLQDFTIYKPITELAKKAAACAVMLAKGSSVEEVVGGSATINNGFGDIPVVWLQPTVVTKENIDDVIIKSGFHTYGEVYGSK